MTSRTRGRYALRAAATVGATLSSSSTGLARRLANSMTATDVEGAMGSRSAPATSVNDL
jgi:hypothetical protein